MIVVKDAGSICRVTLARPEKANALTRAMLLELRDKVQACEAPILVLTGEGKVFSAGADLEEVHQGLSTDPIWEEVSGAIAKYPFGERPVFIDHELTQNSASFVRQGVLDAVITQNTGHLARSALRVLRAKCDGTPVNPSQENIRIDIVIKENLPTMK